MAIYSKLPPIQWNRPVVDPKTGCMTPEFQRWLQQMFGNGEFLNDGKQDQDAALDALSNLSGNGIVAKTAADTFASRTLQNGTGISITNPGGVAGDPTINCTVTGYTAESAQDDVGGILVDSSTIDLTYNDGVPSITASVIAGSIGSNELAVTTVVAGSYTSADITVDADGRITSAANGAGGAAITVKDEGSTLTAALSSMDFVGAGVVATNVGGAVTVTISAGAYTDEQAQDAVGAMVDASLTYVDGTPLLQRAALTGDVTAAAGSNATTIANDAVTFAKLLNPTAASKLIGSTGTSAFEEIGLGGLLEISGTTLQPKLQGAMVKKTADHTSQDYSAGKTMTFESEVYDTDSIHGFASTVTITIASPGVVTWNAHGFRAGATIVLTTTGALPTGLTAGTVYYIVSPAANTFQLSATLGGAAINTSGSQSGTHTATNTSVLRVPSGWNYVEVGGKVDTANVTAASEYQIAILKNGTGGFDGSCGNAAEMPSATLGASASCASGPIAVVAGDDFDLFFRLSTDTSIDITAARTNFWMKRVG